MRHYFTYFLLLFLKWLSRIFYRVEMTWVGKVPPRPWRNIRLVAFLNHTSLFEPVFVAGVPNHFLFRIARHGVVPAADKTTSRPLVGALFKVIAAHVVSITRERDHTWYAVLQRIDPDSMVVIFPEGRMKRANGLDVSGKPMTVRGGVAEIIQTIGEGRMLIAYSEGLHHIQVPGRRPHLFKTARMRLEVVDIGEYIKQMVRRNGPDEFKREVIRDLERRRDRYCPPDFDSSDTNPPAAVAT